MKFLKKSKLAGILALSLTASLFLGACGATDAGSKDDASGNVTLRFTWWGNDIRNKMTMEAIAAFEKDHPNIKIEAEPGEWSAYWDKLATQTAGNDMPDIIQMDQQYIAEYGGRGALLDLNEHKELDSAKLTESSLVAGQIDGKQFGISTGENAFVVMANADLFKEAGLEVPDDKTWTWDQYIDTAAQVAAALPGNSGANYGGTEADLAVWFNQHGQALYGEDGNTGFTESTLAAYWERILKQRDAKAGPSASINSEDANASLEQTLFGTEKIALAWAWSNQVAAFTAATGSDIQLLRAPSIKGSSVENGTFFKPSMFWSASSRTKHPVETATFIDFMLNSEEAGKILLAERGFPSNTETQTLVEPLLDETGQRIASFLKDIAPEVQFTSVVPPVGTGTVGNISRRYTDEVLFERKTPAQAAKEFKAETQGLIDSAAR